MFENLKNGWELGSATRKLVFKDKALFYYPLLGMLVCFIEFLAIFLLPYLLLNSTSTGLLYYVILFAYYVIVFFSSNYILMAMYAAFRSAAGGNKIGMGEAFKQIRPYSMLILEWSVFSAIILVILRVVERRLGLLSRLILGAAASVSIAIGSYFAIPIIMDKKLGPIATFKESTQFVIANFGKTFGGVAYTDLYSLLFILLGIAVLFIGLIASLAAGQPILALVSIAAGIIIIVFGSLLSYTLGNVFRLIIYEYANGKPLPSGFSEEMIKKAIIRKKAKNKGDQGVDDDQGSLFSQGAQSGQTKESF